MAHRIAMVFLGLALGLATVAARPGFSQSAQPSLREILERAQKAQLEKDFELAAQEYRQALKLKPAPELYEKLGLVCFLGNSYPDAIEAFSKATRLDPKRWGSHLFLGVSLYKVNRFQEALPRLERAFKLNPQQNETRYWLGCALHSLGNYERGNELLWSALEKDPENVDVLYALTQGYLDLSALVSKRLDPYPKAREELHKQVGSKLPVVGSAAPWAQEVRRFQALEVHYREIRKSPQPDEESLYILSRIYGGLAQLMAERVWELKPDSYRSHQLLGEAHEGNEKYELAINEYREALRLAPDTPGLHYLIGHSYWQMKRFDEAIPELEKELAFNPHHPSANFVLGHIFAYRRELDKASRHLQIAVEAKPDFVEARKQLGKVLSLMQDHPGAARHLELATAADPQNYSVRYLLAGVYRKMGLQDKAKKELEIFNKLYQEQHGHQRTAELPE